MRIHGKCNNSHAPSTLKTVYILANGAHPDEMPLYAAFHLGFHCLPIPVCCCPECKGLKKFIILVQRL